MTTAPSALNLPLAQLRIAILGLGYVGLPLAVALGTKWETVGFDINRQRIDELRTGHDSSRETDARQLTAARHLRLTDQTADIADCDVYIVTVPTPINDAKQPDLTPVIAATEMVGKVLAQGNLVIYESTVYPGCTEEVCMPILQRMSGLDYNRGFFLGYSPERINPGDKQHRLESILKVTSGSTPEAAERVDQIYRGIIHAGTHRAPSIRVAEAAKVIENTQRDVNIALINELALIFNRLDIDTEAVLAAAATKWNFLPFKPGLVGGHCIGVDPYYLTYKAQQIGYQPEIILAGRRLNDAMGAYVAGEVTKLMVKRGVSDHGRVLILGLTFKENCPDLRNTRVVDIIRELREYGFEVEVQDPWADPREALKEYGIQLIAQPRPGSYDAMVLAVAHREFADMGVAAMRGLGKKNAVLYDVKHLFAAEQTDGLL
jgi:UDP-N-acetyl-D-galactosamine dehydrogenase